MRPFKMFFGLAIAIMLFFFVAKVVVVAFIAAAVMSIIYAVFRRIKDFITYDRYGEYYIKRYDHHSGLQPRWKSHVEPLFHGQHRNYYTQDRDIQYIETV